MATIKNINELCETKYELGNYELGYKQLDDIIGGLKLGTVVAVGGRPAMGKTTFAQNIMLNLLNKYNLPLLYVSLEAGEQKVVNDLSIINSNSDYSTINEDSKSLLKSKNLNLFITTDCIKISELENLLIDHQDIKFIVIDYIQLMQTDMDSKPSVTNDVVNQLKLLAVKYNVIIFALSQLSRNVDSREDKHPIISDFKYSGNLSSVADIILLLYKEDYNDTKDSPLEIQVAKNKYGSLGIAYLGTVKSKRTFIDYN